MIHIRQELRRAETVIVDKVELPCFRHYLRQRGTIIEINVIAVCAGWFGLFFEMATKWIILIKYVGHACAFDQPLTKSIAIAVHQHGAAEHHFGQAIGLVVCKISYLGPRRFDASGIPVGVYSKVSAAFASLVPVS
jgi:hypothetical protein